MCKQTNTIPEETKKKASSLEVKNDVQRLTTSSSTEIKQDLQSPYLSKPSTINKVKKPTTSPSKGNIKEPPSPPKRKKKTIPKRIPKITTHRIDWNFPPQKIQRGNKPDLKIDREFPSILTNIFTPTEWIQFCDEVDETFQPISQAQNDYFMSKIRGYILFFRCRASEESRRVYEQIRDKSFEDLRVLLEKKSQKRKYLKFGFKSDGKLDPQDSGSKKSSVDYIEIVLEE